MKKPSLMKDAFMKAAFAREAFVKAALPLFLCFCLALPFAMVHPMEARADGEDLPADAKTITFADSSLYERICTELESKILTKNDGAKSISISQADLEGTTSLSLRAAGISDLSGLENFAHIKKLDLCQNVVADFSTLSTLTSLETLNLYDNGIGDLAGLERLTNLTTLKLGYNNDSNKRNSGTGMKNLNSLSSLTKLKNLDFSYNWTPTLSTFISNLTGLETLDMSQNMTTGKNGAAADITALTNLTNLKSITLYYNGIMDISPLYSLPNLEKVMLQRNNLRSISGILQDGSPVWKNLKELNISNATYGNFAKINQDTLEVLKQLACSGKFDLIYEKAADTAPLPHIDASGKRFVTYDDFGARADGAYDDYAAMRAAHLFANEYTSTNGIACEVRASAGKTYHIFKFYDDPVTVKTSTNWMGATFIVHDERIEEAISKYRPILKFDNSSDITELKKSDSSGSSSSGSSSSGSSGSGSSSSDSTSLDFTIGKSTRNVKGLSAQLDAAIANLNAKGYQGYHCAAFNSEKQQFFRNGRTKGKAQQDYFNIDRNGNVLNDIQWDFEKLTSFSLTPIQPQPLEVGNGSFVTNALITECELGKTTLTGTWDNYYRDLLFENCTNLKVHDIKHTLSKDCVSGSYVGFLNFQKCSKATLSNCQIFTKKYLTRSTYDLEMRVCTDMHLRNVVSNDIEDTDRYGITGCGYLKDIVYDGCILNRAEAHEGVYNQTVRNCQIGWRGLQLVGGGKLDVIDSTIAAWSMVNLRPDYGSFWNGDIRIVNCTYKKLSQKIPMIADASFTYTDDTHTALKDFGYDLMFPNIYIDNLVIDYNGNKFSTDTSLVPNDSNRMQYQGFPYYWPRNLYLNRYKIINAPSSKVKVRCTYNPIDKLPGTDYNFAITDVTLKLANGTDVTTQATAAGIFEGVVSNGSYSTEENVSLLVRKNNSANNSVSIYKDVKALERDLPVDDEISRTFTEVGNYRIEVSSADIGNSENSGCATYEFRIKPPSPKADKNLDGGSSKNKQANVISVGKSSLSKTFKVPKRNAKLAKAASFKIGAKVLGAAKISYKAKLYLKSGKITKVLAKRFLKVSNTGKVTIKKGAPRGTYKVKVEISAKDTSDYKAATVFKTLVVKVK